MSSQSDHKTISYQSDMDASKKGGYTLSDIQGLKGLPLYEELVRKAQSVLSRYGITEYEIQDYIHSAYIYFANREKEKLVTFTSEKHLVNAIVWKAQRLLIDQYRSAAKTPSKLIIDESSETEDITQEELLDHLYYLNQNSFTESTIVSAPSDPALLYEQRELVQLALDSMSPNQRLAWRLVLAGATVAEIASMLEMSTNAAYKLLQRGKEKARINLTNNQS